MMINDLNEYGAPAGTAERGMVARLDRLEAMVSQVVELVGGKVPAAREKVRGSDHSTAGAKLHTPKRKVEEGGRGGR